MGENCFYETVEGLRIVDSKYWPQKLKEYLKLETAFLKEKIKSNSTLLDVGCGKGRYLKLFQGKCRQLVGVDSSKKMTAHCNRIFAGKDNVSILQEDIKTVKLPENYFDYVICMFNTFGNMDRQTQIALLNKVEKALKPDGLLLLGVYSEKAKETQIEFYQKIGLVIKKCDEHFVYTDKLNSERFSEQKIKGFVKRNSKMRVKAIKELNSISLLCEIRGP